DGPDRPRLNGPTDGGVSLAPNSGAGAARGGDKPVNVHVISSCFAGRRAERGERPSARLAPLASRRNKTFANPGRMGNPIFACQSRAKWWIAPVRRRRQRREILRKIRRGKLDGLFRGRYSEK